MTDAPDYDVFIVGGGPVGATLALALEGQGLAVGLAEARDLAGVDDRPAQASYDDKALALSRATVEVLNTLGAWPELAGAATPITSVHVSQRGRLGRALLTAGECGVDSLGQVVPARSLGTVLNAGLQHAAGTRLYSPATVAGIEDGENSVRLALDAGGNRQTITTRLVVGADGAQSVLRDHLGIGARRRDYEQLALAANVTPAFAHGGRAFERFTGSGPLALLPMQANRMGLVWAGAPDAIEGLAGLPDEAFLARLQSNFGHRLGQFRRVGRRKTYPLQGMRAEALHGHRAVLVGNAAQTLHPVAAQGFNLGVRDVAALSETLVEAVRGGGDPGSNQTLAAYADWRRPDRDRTARFTHGLVRLFDLDLPLLDHARGLGLFALDMAPPLKRAFSRRAMGLAGRVPRLARGVRLDAE